MRYRFLMKLGLLITTLACAACGTTSGERGVTGAGLGALGGAAVGAPAVGAITGGAAGLFTESDDIDLGKPVWDWD